MLSLSENQDFQRIESAFPRVASKVSLYWGYKEFIDYIDGLLHDTRCEAPRKGFPAEIIFALHNLNEMHKELFPSHYPRSRNYGWF